MTTVIVAVYAVAFIALCAVVMRWAARRSVLWGSAATIALGVLFFSVVFPGAQLAGITIPGIAMVLTGAELPQPVPSFAYWIYIILVLLGVLLVTSASEQTYDQLKGPIIRWLAGDVEGAAKRLRAPLLFGLLPLLAGVLGFSSVVPSTSAPVVGRQAHPSISYDEKLTNPLREPSAGMIKGHDSREAFIADATRKGRHLYAKNCSPCHGGKADGQGHMAPGQRLPPADFTDPGTIATLVEAYAFKRIQDGGIGLPVSGTPWDSAMPRWKGELSDEEIFQILLAEYDLAGVSPRVPEKLE